MNVLIVLLSCLIIFTGGSVALSQTDEQIRKLTFDQPPLEDSPWFYHRMTAARRGAKLSEEGGTDATEHSVMSALRWLKSNQTADGSWFCMPSDGAATGLAILAFLGHGETPSSPEFGTTVRRGLEFLASLVDEDGGVNDRHIERNKRRVFRDLGSGHENVNMYVQAIVTEALAEGYGMTQCDGLRYPMERACDFIIKAQAVIKLEDADGGWRYTPVSRDSDLSVSSWQIMALKLGRQASSSVPRALLEKALSTQWSFRVMERNPVVVRDSAVDGNGSTASQKGPRPVFHVPNKVFEKAQHYLWNTYSAPGFSYEEDVGMPTVSMTAVGVFCSYLLGCSNDPRITVALNHLDRHPFQLVENNQVHKIHNPLRIAENKKSWYEIYFTTQAAFQGGNPHWQMWNKQLQQVVLSSQDGTGRWPALGHGMDQVASNSGVYPTALGALTFESYYRYPRLNASGDYIPDEIH